VVKQFWWKATTPYCYPVTWPTDRHTKATTPYCYPSRQQMESSNLDLHLIHGYLGPWESAPYPKQHLDLFSHFCRAHKRDQQTDTQTYHATPSVAIAASYAMHVMLWTNNNSNNADVYGAVMMVQPLWEFTCSFDECSSKHFSSLKQLTFF